MTALDWIWSHRSPLVPAAAVLDIVTWAALGYLAWHHFGCVLCRPRTSPARSLGPSPRWNLL